MPASKIDPRRMDDWLDAYGRDHRHPVNKRLHNACVPAIVVSLLGLLWELPVPAALAAVSPALNWGTLLLLGTLAWYGFLSLPLALGMLPCALVAVAVVAWLDGLPAPLWLSCAIIFAIAWAGQFIGHWYEGARPSFFRDLKFLLIGPLWLLARLYRQLGLRY